MCSGRFFRDIWNSFFCCWNRETNINKSARLAYKVRREVRLEELYLNSTPRQLADSAHEDHFRISGIRTEEGILETFRSVLDLDLIALRDALHNKTYTAVTVLHAFVWRALDINKELNCITQIVESSFEAARSLDEKDGMNPKELPLYGLPFSVKSNMAVSGCPMTLGFAKRSDHTSASTCPMVQFLCDLGAIPFCLTNVPQGILSYVTSNPLDGFTRNPWDLERTPGGSSGGEAALLAAGGASFGVGNDLGGSLRIPAAFCGLVTLKPSEHRLFTTKTEGGLPGKGPLGLSHGFFTRNVEEQEFLLSFIVGREDYCTLCPQTDRLEWKKLRDKGGKLNITYFTSDEYMPPVPSSVRAVIETIEALRSDQRFNVMEPISIKEIAGVERIESLVEMFFRNVMPDNGECARDMYNGEKSAKHMELFIGLLRLKPSRLVQWLTSGWLIGCVSKKFAILATSFNWGPRGVRENQAKTEVFRERWMEYMRVNRIDAIICPAFITPAQGFHYPQLLAGGTFLTGLFNMLDVPAGVVPVGHVTEKDIEDLKNLEIFKVNGDFLLKKQKETSLGTEGLPIAVQVVTLPQQEELCVYVMKSVEEKMIGNVEKLEWVEEGELKNRFSKIPSKTREAPGNLEIWTNDEENEENESLKLNLEENTVHWTQKLKVGFVNEGYCGTGPSTPQNEHRSTSASPRKQLGRAQSLCRIEF